MIKDELREPVDDAFRILYVELRRLASKYVNQEGTAHSWHTTDLVHEAYMKLAKQDSQGWRDRAGFFAASATVMRRILVDHARSRKAQKRGVSFTRSALDEAIIALESRGRDLVELDEALTRLSAFDRRKASIVEIRFFVGLSVEETAELLNLSPRTVAREWNLAKSWLLGELQSGSEQP